MPEKKPERNYRISMPVELWERMRAAAEIDGRNIKLFIMDAVKTKIEKIEMESITRPWVPKGIRRAQD